MSAIRLSLDFRRRGAAIVYSVLACGMAAKGQTPAVARDDLDRQDLNRQVEKFKNGAFTKCGNGAQSPQDLYYSGPFDVDALIAPDGLPPGVHHGQMVVESRTTISPPFTTYQEDPTVDPRNQWKGAIVLNSAKSRERFRYDGNDWEKWGDLQTHPAVIVAGLMKRNGRWFACDSRLGGYRLSLVASAPPVAFDLQKIITMVNTNLAGSKELLDGMAPWPTLDDLLKTIKPPSCGELFPRPLAPGQVTITSNPGFVHVTSDNAGERTQYTIMMGADGNARQVSATINSPETNWSLDVRSPVNNDHLRTNIIKVKKPGFNIDPIYPDIPAQRRAYKKLVEDIETNADAAIKAAEDFRSHSRQGTYTPTSDSPGTFTTILPLPVPLNPDVAPETPKAKAQIKARDAHAGPNGTPLPTSGLVDIKYDPITVDGHYYLITLTADGKKLLKISEARSMIDNPIIVDTAHPKGEVTMPDGTDAEVQRRFNGVVQKYITDHNLKPQVVPPA